MNREIRKILLGFLGITCVLSLSACQNAQQKQQQAQRSATKQDVKLPSGNYFEQDQQHRTFVANQQRGLRQITKQMNANYHQIGKTTYNQKLNVITLNLQGKRTENTLKLAKQGNGQARKFWRELTQGLSKTAKSTSKSAKDPKLTIAVTNNNNQQHPLYAVQKNKVLSDHLNHK